MTARSLARQGRVLATATVDTDVAPGSAASYPVPVRVPDLPGQYTVTVSFCLREATAWAPVGFEVAGDQEVVQAVVAVEGTPLTAFAAAGPGQAPELVTGLHSIGVRGHRFEALLSRVTGDGTVEVTQVLERAEGTPDLPELGCLMEVPGELDRLCWYGEGPEECHVDRRRGARLGVYSAMVADRGLV